MQGREDVIHVIFFARATLEYIMCRAPFINLDCRLYVSAKDRPTAGYMLWVSGAGSRDVMYCATIFSSLCAYVDDWRSSLA